MTAEEEPGGHQRSAADEPPAAEQLARVSTLEIRSKGSESEGQEKTVDFMTLAMFIVGKCNHAYASRRARSQPANTPQMSSSSPRQGRPP